LKTSFLNIKPFLHSIVKPLKERNQMSLPGKNARQKINPENQKAFKNSAEAFKVPEGYFEKLQNEILDKCVDDKPEMKTRFVMLPKRKTFAIAASVGILILAFSFLYLYQIRQDKLLVEAYEVETQYLLGFIDENLESVDEYISQDDEFWDIGNIAVNITDAKVQEPEGLINETNDDEDILIDFIEDDELLMYEYLDENGIY